MKSLKRSIVAIVALLLIWGGVSAAASAQEVEDRTLSPYFFVESDDPKLDRLPLKSTAARVSISGVIADVRVTQVYANVGKKPLEAIYVFPASTRAAVYGMKMTIGSRVIEAKIKKRDEARREYEQARNAGKNASLLEQERPNVFSMNVANIMPGDTIEVELKYTELLVPTDRVYEFVYPTVVGPRYSNAKAHDAPSAEQWVENPYLRQGELPKTTLNMDVAIDAGMPVREVTCASHKVNTVFESQSRVKLSLDKSEAHSGNRDFILRYRLDGDQISTGLLLSSQEKENFFVLMMQPPKRLSTAHIPGREYIFIVDVSGSMHGFPLTISKKLLSNLISSLRPTDKFNVLLFSGGNTLMAEASLPATSANISKALDTIDRQRGGGGTELLPALKRALSLKKDEGFSRTMVIVTDGYVSVEEEAFDLIRNSLDQANLFAFGIGSSVNRHLIEGLAHVGMGEPFILTNPEAAQAQAERFRQMIASPALTQIKVSFDGFEAYDVEPLSVPDVLADRPVLVFGKWRGPARGKISLRGFTGNGKYTHTLSVADYAPSSDNGALKYLWARHRISILSDYNQLRPNDERIQEVTRLGLAYNLLTAYTSFVAVDTQVRNTQGVTTVNQPLPLPEGVSDYAVGRAGFYPASPAVAGDGVMQHKLQGRLFETQESVTKDSASPAKGETSGIKIVDVTGSGSLSKTDISQAAQAQFKSLLKCAGGKKYFTTLKIHLTINADGTVSKVELAEGGISDKVLRRCVMETLRKWRFPAVKNGGETRATLTLQWP